jgi:hypothetical protein
LPALVISIAYDENHQARCGGKMHPDDASYFCSRFFVESAAELSPIGAKDIP